MTDEGYVGEDVHFAARVAASGHRGQVLVSAATAGLVDGALVDLGEHRLKDIAEPVAIYQFGEGRFPPLKTISNTNLPRPASSFVGRERELAEVLARVEGGARLLTLTGPGGSGKTRLALEAAATLVPEYKAGVFWVGLASFRDPALVGETIAQTLGAKDGLAAHVGEREMLLLLDNLEQVIEAAPELSALAAACPNLTLLVTSRELLRVQGEVEYPVPPLAEPEAVDLFCDRAQIEPSDEIAELCARVDNLPLAVELAAARSKALTPAQILARLSHRLDLLKGGRDADPRQQTLTATIEWSYDLLSPEEQQLFARLSVFAGGCTLEAAEEVCDADLDTLQSLVEKSLLRFTNERYWMLETIREYAVERLEEAGEAEEARRQHAYFLLGLVSALESAFGSDSEMQARFTREQDNFREALAWSERAGQRDVQLDLIGLSWPFWWYRGHSSEGLRWVESALGHRGTESTSRRAKVLLAGAMFACRLGELDVMKGYAERSLAIAEELEDEQGSIWPLIFLGLWAGETGDYERAEELYAEAISAATSVGDRKLIGIATNNLGNVAMQRREFTRAIALFQRALQISREIGTHDETAVVTLNIAECLLHLERFDEATHAAREGLLLARQVGSSYAMEYGFFLFAALAWRRGDEDTHTVRLLGITEALRDELGGVNEDKAELELLAAMTGDLVASLGDTGYATALAEGRAMGLDKAVDFVLASLD